MKPETVSNTASASRSASSKAFELRLRKIDGVLNRFALLCAYGDHFADCALRGHLRADARRRRITRKEGRDALARRVIVEGTFGGLFLGPGLEVAQLLIGWNVDAAAPGDQLFDRRAG